MMYLHWRAMSWVALVPSSMRYASRTVSPLRSSSGTYLHLYWRRCASLRDILEAGAIHPSQSLWCNAVVMVSKKDGTLHFCIEFRCLNMWMKKDSYPLPHIPEVLKSMVVSAHFSSMGFRSGFWQIKMAPESQQYMAFMVSNLRFYKFTHMPFGLCNTPATFQHLMQNTLGKLNLMYCV